MSSKVALILGSGPRIGSSVAAGFAAAGYKVAVASRKGGVPNGKEDYLSLQADLSNPDSIPSLYQQVQARFGSTPNVVIYNAATLTPPKEEGNIFSIDPNNVASDLGVNTVTAYAAAKAAVEAWSASGTDDGRKKSFIYTGNANNKMVIPFPLMITLAIGKNASSAWIAIADSLYKTKGFRFFYADERHVDGKVKGMELDGEAHAEFYLKLASQSEDIPWDATFVKGKGYTKF